MAEIKASHKYARISASKVRPFAKLIKGMVAQDALNQLQYTPNRGAKMLRKVLASAVANAENREARNAGSLTISVARVDGGPSFKRMRPRARGSANIIERKFAHIHVSIDAPDVIEKSKNDK